MYNLAMAEKEAVRVIMENQKRVLVIRRGLGLKNDPGKLSLPGGKAEADDYAAEAEREVFEELGLKVPAHLLTFLASKRKMFRGQEWRQTYFWTRITEGQVDEAKLSFRREEIAEVLLLDTGQVDQMRDQFAFGDGVVAGWFLSNFLRRL